VIQVLVQWSSMPASLATWEDLEALRQKFPGAPDWGQSDFLEVCVWRGGGGGMSGTVRGNTREVG
jgi:hypothetical protein